MRTLVLVATVAVSLSLAALSGPARACDAEKDGARLSAADPGLVQPPKPAADAACGCGMGGGGKCCSAGAAAAAPAPAASTVPAADAGKPAGCGCGKKKPGAS